MERKGNKTNEQAAFYAGFMELYGLVGLGEVTRRQVFFLTATGLRKVYSLCAQHAEN
jgi:hypothetical protein